MTKTVNGNLIENEDSKNKMIDIVYVAISMILEMLQKIEKNGEMRTMIRQKYVMAWHKKKKKKNHARSIDD